MKFGLTENQLKFLQELLAPLNSQGVKIYVFGSRSRGDFKKFSDIDIMVESEKNQFFDLEEIKEHLVKSDFPFKVDLVSYQDFPDSYKKQYESEKEELFEIN